MSNHVTHYVSQDVVGGEVLSTWSVYREEYVDANAEEPIDGSQTHVSTHDNEARAQAHANLLSRGVE